MWLNVMTFFQLLTCLNKSSFYRVPVPTVLPMSFIAFIPTPSTAHLRHFFAVWDVVEQMYPLGVDRLEPFLSTFDIPAAMCDEIDSRLFFDLVVARQSGVQRMRVEGRHTGVLFWARVSGLDDEHAVRVNVSFQASPAVPFRVVVSVEARPRALMACFVGYHRMMLMGRRGRGCWYGGGMRVGRVG